MLNPKDNPSAMKSACCPPLSTCHPQYQTRVLTKRLTAFHTPDGIHCWNRLIMVATPSSAVQQTAYLEALDRYIDFDENDNIRKCLLDENGNKLKDAEGNPKTLRHRFAIYCDDISAWADTLEELYDLQEALICC